MGMNSTASSGYVAVGFPSRPGRMSGATAMILQYCGSAGGATGCSPSGAVLTQYYMASTLAGGEWRGEVGGGGSGGASE